MPAPRQIIVNSYARRHTVEELDTAIAQLAEAYLTSSFSNLNVLGMSIGQDHEATGEIMETLEEARKVRLAEDDATGATSEQELDAIKPLGHELRFNYRQIE